MFASACRSVFVATSLVAAGCLAGCTGGASGPEATLAKGQVAVDAALDGWVRGEAPEKFACTDPDWQAGLRLLSFLTSDTKIVGAAPDQVRCRVALTLKDRKGRTVDKDAYYLVHFGDAVTVRRADLK